MMFRLFEVIADRVREQAAVYASAQARIGARALAAAIDPLGLMPSGIGMLAVPAPEPATAPRPRVPANRRRGRRGSRPAPKRGPRQAGHPAAKLA